MPPKELEVETGQKSSAAVGWKDRPEKSNEIVEGVRPSSDIDISDKSFARLSIARDMV